MEIADELVKEDVEESKKSDIKEKAIT